MLSGLFKGGGKKDKGEKRDASKFKYGQGAAVFPGSDYTPGTSPEWNYYPNFQYATGGLVGLANGGPVDPQAQMPQDMTFPQNGIGSLVSPEQIPESPYPVSQTGTEPPAPTDPEMAVPTNNDKELIAQTVEAIQGKIPNPEQILLAFVKEFGEPALNDLMMRVKSTMAPQQGRSDGQSDSIPAMINGTQPAALSEGEYVVPADAVSGLGNGSTEAGARQLDQMVGGVRQMRGGGAVMPPSIDPNQFIPYAKGGIVTIPEEEMYEEEYIPTEADIRWSEGRERTRLPYRLRREDVEDEDFINIPYEMMQGG